MRTRHIVAFLLGMVVLLVIVLWLTSNTVQAPHPHTSPFNGGGNAPANAPARNAPPPANEAGNEPEAPPGNPPPRPEHNNDPSSGRAWMRLIDEDTGHPLADTEVKLVPAGRYRLAPWPDADKKYWREFTLTAGEIRTIEVQGG